MTFDYSITKQKLVKCSNTKCQHVFKVYDRREPVINDPGFVVKRCPDCQRETRFWVWNVDYFKEKDVVGVYEEADANNNLALASVEQGETLEESIEENLRKVIYLSPKVHFWQLMGQKHNCSLNEIAKNEIEHQLRIAKELSLGGKNCMMGVDSVIIKELHRKNAYRDYSIFVKRPLGDNDFNADRFTYIHNGKVILSKQIDGLFTRDECLSILDFCLKRWTISSRQVVIAVPFIGFHYNNKKCKNQVLYFWAYLNGVLDMKKTILLTRKAEFNRMRVCLNELKGNESFDFKKYWGKLDDLQAAADTATKRKKRKGETSPLNPEHVYFTNKFHSKFYAGIYDDRVELLIGSYNVHEGEVLENLTFRECTVGEFKEKFLNRILPDKELIKTEESYSNAIAFTVNGDDVKMELPKFDEYIKAMIVPV